MVSLLLQDAVLTGVDGIGLGGTQILRDKDESNDHHSNFVSRRAQRPNLVLTMIQWEQNIVLIQEKRDGAESSIRGKGVLLLARLDQMHFEGSLTDEEALLREEIYPLLRIFDPSPKPPAERDEAAEAKLKERTAKVEAVLNKPVAQAILGLEQDGDAPFVGRAKRILRTETPRLRRGQTNDDEWVKFRQMLEKLSASNNDVALSEKYKDAPGVWYAIRKAYRVSIGEGDKVSSLFIWLECASYRLARASPATQCFRSPSHKMSWKASALRNYCTLQ